MSSSETVDVNSLSIADIAAKFARGTGDTGSPEVQVALLTKRIEKISSHMKKSPKDFHTERGMMKLISRRKNLLGYLKEVSVDRYKALITSLGLRK